MEGLSQEVPPGDGLGAGRQPLIPGHKQGGRARSANRGLYALVDVHGVLHGDIRRRVFHHSEPSAEAGQREEAGEMGAGVLGGK